MPPRRSSTDFRPATVQSALDAGCLVDTLCLICDRVTRLKPVRVGGTRFCPTAAIQLPLGSPGGSGTFTAISRSICHI
jgi:hypothetical protein